MQAARCTSARKTEPIGKILADADAYDQMRYKLLAGGDPVADLWEYEEDEEEEADND